MLALASVFNTGVDTLLFTSAEFVTSVSRMFVCVYSVLSGFFGRSWPLSSCSLERVCPVGSSIAPILLVPALKLHIDAACTHLRWSILATWPPYFHLRLPATATMSFVLFLFLFAAFVILSFQTTCSILRPIFLSSSSPLCRVLILIFLRQTVSLGNTVLQLFCCYYSWCLYR